MSLLTNLASVKVGLGYIQGIQVRADDAINVITIMS